MAKGLVAMHAGFRWGPYRNALTYLNTTEEEFVSVATNEGFDEAEADAFWQFLAHMQALYHQAAEGVPDTLAFSMRAQALRELLIERAGWLAVMPNITCDKDGRIVVRTTISEQQHDGDIFTRLSAMVAHLLYHLHETGPGNIMHCQHCGRLSTSGHELKKFCSDACRLDSHRAKHRQEVIDGEMAEIS